jgi:hypothetical protein
MRLSILPLILLWAGVADGAVVHVPIKSGRVLKSGETYTVTIEATKPVEIGWDAVQAKRCTTNCVQATDVSDVTGHTQYRIATPTGASKEYAPVSGKISVEYKNVSGEPVTSNVYRVRRTCEAAACKFLDERQKGRWLVFKVDEFKTIATSRDGSYSVISGITSAGKPFSFKAVWWTDQKAAAMINCAPFVKRYLDNHTRKEEYRPYIISGQAVSDSPDIVLKSVDTCAPRAPNFGVPDQNVFK